LQRVRFKQQPEIGEFPEIVGGHRRNLEPARAFGDHQSFGRQPVEQLAQRADADPVGILEGFEPKLLRRRESAKNDVVAQSPVGSPAVRYPY
jgi:hypothetical protein